MFAGIPLSDPLTMFHWIAEDNALVELADKQRPDQPLFLDTEFMRERTYWPHLALLQVNDGNGCHLIDPLTTSVEPMHDLLASRPLVMHACSEDLEALWVGCKVKPLEVLDTQIGAALCGHDMQSSYQKLVEKLLGVSLPKTAPPPNCRNRPLTARQLNSPPKKVGNLPGIFNCLTSVLEPKGHRAGGGRDAAGWW